MKVRRYWLRDLRNDKEYVTNAAGIKELAEKTAIPLKSLQILRTYSKPGLDPAGLILKY